MGIRAKFKVGNINLIPTAGPTEQIQVQLNAVYSPDPNSENATWSKWTPSGQLSMTITNPACFDQFELGKEYYLDITPAEA